MERKISGLEIWTDDAWFSKEFDDFRNHLKYACLECAYRTDCMGGCPICPEIVLCNMKELREGR